MHAFANFRDVAAGLPAGMLRRGVLLRSDAPLAGYPAPAAAVAWPPTTVIDLRHPGEAAGPHPLATTSAVHAVSLVDPARPAPGGPRAGDGLHSFYERLLETSAAEALVRAVGIAAAASGPVLVHCLAGKDRTGVTVALFLRLSGIDRDLVVAEYLRTNLNAVALAERVGAHYVAIGRRAADDPPLTPESVEAPLASIAAVLDHWDAHACGARGWYLAHGGTDAAAAALARRLLA